MIERDRAYYVVLQRDSKKMPTPPKTHEAKQRQIAGILPHRFKPGTSGNPKGRPPDKLRLTTALRELLDSVVPDELRVSMIPSRLRKKVELKEDLTWKELLALRAVLKAATGDVHAFKEIADRDEGKPKQRIELVGGEGNEIKIRVAYDQTVTRSKE